MQLLVLFNSRHQLVIPKTRIFNYNGNINATVYDQQTITIRY